MQDDEEHERIRQAYETGEMLIGELKKICIQFVQDYIKTFQERRAQVTDEALTQLMSKRLLLRGGNPNPIVVEDKKRENQAKEIKEENPRPRMVMFRSQDKRKKPRMRLRCRRGTAVGRVSRRLVATRRKQV